MKAAARVFVVVVVGLNTFRDRRDTFRVRRAFVAPPRLRLFVRSRVYHPESLLELFVLLLQHPPRLRLERVGSGFRLRQRCASRPRRRRRRRRLRLERRDARGERRRLRGKRRVLVRRAREVRGARVLRQFQSLQKRSLDGKSFFHRALRVALLPLGGGARRLRRLPSGSGVRLGGAQQDARLGEARLQRRLARRALLELGGDGGGVIRLRRRRRGFQRPGTRGGFGGVRARRRRGRELCGVEELRLGIVARAFSGFGARKRLFKLSFARGDVRARLGEFFIRRVRRALRLEAARVLARLRRLLQGRAPRVRRAPRVHRRGDVQARALRLFRRFFVCGLQKLRARLRLVARVFREFQ